MYGLTGKNSILRADILFGSVMGKIEARYLRVSAKSNLDEVSGLLDQLKRYPIEKISWPNYSYKPAASFAIAHNDDCILLKYFVTENCIRALYRETHDPVFRDSCVEFFISFDNDEEYYNLEFNCIGTCMLGFGNGKANRKLVPEEYIKNIRRQSIIKTVNVKNVMLTHWELTLIIPREVFIYHSISTFKDRNCRANLFKCGDELPEPHFLSWQRIESDFPDFHQPEFFGAMKFICE
jgi:hypothetical protein